MVCFVLDQVPCVQADQALVSYKEAVRLSPCFAEAHCNLGVLHKGAGRLTEAVTCYEAALQASPGLQIVRANLAVAYTEQAAAHREAGRFEEGAPLPANAALQPGAMPPSLLQAGEDATLETMDYVWWLRPGCAQ